MRSGDGRAVVRRGRRAWVRRQEGKGMIFWVMHYKFPVQIRMDYPLS